MTGRKHELTLLPQYQGHLRASGLSQDRRSRRTQEVIGPKEKVVICASSPASAYIIYLASLYASEGRHRLDNSV